VELALRLIEECARAEPRVLGEPSAPAGFLAGFADSGLNLELGLWIRDPENGQLGLKSAINRRILEAFKANGISIPYPRRDVRLIPEPATPSPPV
jgi:small-conductance mechanosensitive channel